MHSKLHISSIPIILKRKGVKHVVIAPGSRNAPLTQVFFREFKTHCISIVDERSAAYFALGIALETRIPVVIITTSGTAVLNLGPALAEAFYQGVPLIALTADRPPEWIDQEDNQTIRQTNVFNGNIKKSYELPLQTSTKEDVWLTERIINEAFYISVTGKPGPVHINIPLREPLYDNLPVSHDVTIIEQEENSNYTLSEKLISDFQRAENILIVIGQRKPEKQFGKLIENLLSDNRICVSVEAIANLNNVEGIINLDIILATQTDERIGKPDLVLYFGGQVVSKRTKNYLRTFGNCEFWYISPDGRYVDTFQNLNCIIRSDENQFIHALSEHLMKDNKQPNFRNICTETYKKAMMELSLNAKEIEYSDLAVFYNITGKFSQNDIVFVGNSSVIRYLQLFTGKAGIYYSNRGTSGIDGCLSTAVGVAWSTQKKVFAILGELSFLYDSNGLWNNDLPENLKIIVINNGGGGIFSLIDGPTNRPEYKKYFLTKSNVDISKLCEAFHVKYYKCESLNAINNVFEGFSSGSASLMEIKTPTEISPVIFRNFINNLKKKNLRE